jgi:outer membrane protein assembly factor BamB
VLVDGDKLVCTPGGEKNTMVALNKKTGEPIWSMSQPGNRGAGHSSIVITTIGGTRVYVQTTGSGAIGVRDKDGKLLWNYDIDSTTAVIPTPVIRDDLVFFTAGYGRGGALLRQVPGGKGEVSMKEIYPLNNKLGNKHGGVVLVGDYLFGDSDDSGVPFCADLMTGEIKWKKRGSGSGSVAVTAAEGNLYLRYQDGTMALLGAVPEQTEEKGSFKIPDVNKPSWPHPVIAGGKLYLREQDNLFCYDIKK